MRSHFRTACIIAGTLATAALVACSDDVLAPPDGLACTVGTLAPGDSVARDLNGASCEVWSDYNFRNTLAQSWTINAKAHHAYVVTFYHVPDANAVDHISADLELYGRNAAGDAEFSTGEWVGFGTPNGNNALHEELIFTTTVDRQVSIRVEARNPADTGSYTIQLATCAATPVAPGAISAPVAVGSACPTHAELGGGLPTRTAFWTFSADPSLAPQVTFTRAAGNATFRSWVTGEGLDFGCYGELCTYEDGGVGNGPVTLSPSIFLRGAFTATATIHADSAASITLGLETPAAAVARPTFSGPARAGRPR